MPHLVRYRDPGLEGPAGAIEARLHEAEGARSAAVLVGGAGGGFDTPAGGLYERLARHLPADGIAVMRVRFRLPGALADARVDVLAAVDWLVRAGVERVGFVGHSFGGAVVIGAAAETDRAAAVVAISTQSFGTEAVARLGEVPLLLVHGTEDEVLPPASSLHVYRRAGPLAQLRLIEGGDHVLDGAADEVYRVTHAWLLEHLRADRPPTAG